MNWDQVEGNWKQFKGKAREMWGELTNDDVESIMGKKDQLAGKLQERYGWAKDEVSKQIERFESALEGGDQKAN